MPATGLRRKPERRQGRANQGLVRTGASAGRTAPALGFPTQQNGVDHELIRRAYVVSHADANAVPSITLRGGDALDGYDHPPSYDTQLDEPTDEYTHRALNVHIRWQRFRRLVCWVGDT